MSSINIPPLSVPQVSGVPFDPNPISGSILVADGSNFNAVTPIGMNISPSGQVIITEPVQQTIVSGYNAFGDSITAGTGGSPWYVAAIASDTGATTTNRGLSGYYAFNMASDEIFPYENPTEKNETLYTILIGTNDANNKGLGTWEGIYKNCLQASAAWLAIPATSKVFGQDAGNTTSGSWANDDTYQTGIGFKSTTNASTLSIPITTYGGPLYLWYRTIDGDAGVFTVQIDGDTARSVNGFTTPASGGNSIGILRMPNIAAGSHAVLVTVTSSTNASNIVSILAVGTVPQNRDYKCPKVFVGGVIRQASDANAATTAGYNADALVTISQLTADGLPVYFVDVRKFVNSSTDMNDALHPNSIGHSHLRDAFESVMQFTGSPVFDLPLRLNVTTPADVTSYSRFNALNNVSTTALNGGINLYNDGSNSFGMDFGFGAGGYLTRLFSTQGISFSQAPALPTAQSSFTQRLLLLCTTGQLVNYATTPTNTAGYFLLNANGLANTSALNPGISVFSNGNYGMDLGYNGSYRTRIFTDSAADIAFAKGNGGPTQQSDFTELMVIKTTGNVNITQGDLDLGTHRIHSVINPSVSGDAATKDYVDRVNINVSGTPFDPNPKAANILIADGTSFNSQTLTGDGSLTTTGLFRVNNINSNPLGVTTPTASNFLIADGTRWNSVAPSGDITITASGSVTITKINSIAIGGNPFNQYALLTGTNQPFTGNLNISTNPANSGEVKLTSPLGNYSRLVRVSGNDQVNLYNQIVYTVSNGVTAYTTTGAPTVSTDGIYTILKYTGTGTFVLTTASISVDSLVVGGGGGGCSGGGGAGGLIYTIGETASAGTFNITVGTGGAGTTNSNPSNPANTGTNSVFSTHTAYGGGGGGGTNFAGHIAGSGGSGGGGGADSANNQAGGIAVVGQGNTGGINGQHAGGNNPAGGGGGAGAIGGSGHGAQLCGDGGVGLSNSITGAAVFYAGGGGGMFFAGGGTAGVGGNGGGGAGAATNGVNGTANTGGGGGGSNSGGVGGTGGTGVVLLRFLTIQQGATSTREVNVVKSIGSATTGEAGVQTFGDGLGQTVIDGLSIRLQVADSQIAQIDSNGSNFTNNVGVSGNLTTVVTGDLSGWLPNPTVAKVSGVPFQTFPKSGNILIANGTQYNSQTISGDSSLTSTGAITNLKVSGTPFQTFPKSGNLLIADGTNFNSETLSGDSTLTSTGVMSNTKILGIPLQGINATAGAILIGDGTGYNSFIPSGDLTHNNQGKVTLASVNGNVGTFGDTANVPQITVNAKGLITAVSNIAIAPQLRHQIWVQGGNGEGSTNNMIRQFSYIAASQGTNIVYASGATTGGTFTIQASGLYSISYTDTDGTGGVALGLSLNSNQLTTAYSTIAAQNAIGAAFLNSAAQWSNVSVTLPLISGDIIRGHGTTANRPNGTSPNTVMLRITQVGP